MENLTLPIHIKSQTGEINNNFCVLEFYRNDENENFKTIIGKGDIDDSVHVSDASYLPNNFFNKIYTNSLDIYNINKENNTILLKKNGVYEHNIKLSYKMSASDGVTYNNIRDLRLCIEQCDPNGKISDCFSIYKTKSSEFITLNDTFYIESIPNSSHSINFYIIQNITESTDILFTIFNIKWVIKKIV